MRNLLRLIVFLIPTQLAIHFWPDWSFVYGIRVDYFSPTVYLTDILITAFLVVFLIQSREVVLRTISKYKYLIVLFILFSAVNISVSQNQQIALIKWIKVYELMFFAYAIAKTSLVKDVLVSLSLSLLLVAFIGIFQFVKQESVGGLLYFFGERSFASSHPGIALVQLFGSDYLRTYSIFPHPNALAGYLLVSLFLLYLHKKLFINKLLLYSSLTLGILALFLTFSVTVYSVGLFLLSITLISQKITLGTGRVFLIGLLVCIGLSVVLPVLSNLIFYKGNPNLTSSLDIYERLWLAIAAGEMLAKSPLFGVGLNNYIFLLPSTHLPSPVIWILQPVHNIFLLLLVETGIIGLVVTLAGILKVLRKLFSNNNLKIVLPLTAIVLTGMGDHYWLTIQQNQLLLALIIGLSFNDEALVY